MRESGNKLKGEVHTGHKEKLSPCEDSQAVGQVAQQVFKTQLDKPLSKLL